MNIVAKASGGTNIVARPQARATWYPAASVRAAQVAVYWRYVNEPAAAARHVGMYAPGQEVSIPYNPLEDRDVIMSTISIAADGTRSVREISDAHEELLTFQRETAAPVVNQVPMVANKHSRVTLALDGFSSLAIKRRVRIADDEAMTVNVQELEFNANPGDVLPRVQSLDRSDSDPGTRTVWVQIAHSSGGEYGADSTPQQFTYADDTEAGGSGDDAVGDPFGQVRFDV